MSQGGGGYRQKLARSKNDGGNMSSSSRPTTPRTRSKLLTTVLEEWSLGRMSPQKVQKFMFAAKLDIEGCGGQVPLDIELVAGIGSSGVHPEHCDRDLLNLVGNKLAEPYCVEIPMKCNSIRGWHMVEQELWLPHQVFASIFEQYPTAFEAKIQGQAGEVEKFWEAMQGNPQLVDHPVLDIPGYQSCVIPLSLHGDGVPITGVGKSWGKSMDVWSWCSLLASGRTIESREREREREREKERFHRIEGQTSPSPSQNSSADLHLRWCCSISGPCFLEHAL